MNKLLTLLLGFCAFNTFASDISPEQQKNLIYLLRQDCGACHGMTLKGGLGPALLPENLKDKPLEFITQTILTGRINTAMPPWRGLLTDIEAAWLAEQLINGIDNEQ